MKILNVEQIRALDAQTVENEPIASIDLMERASNTFTNWFLDKFKNWANPVYIFCGPGNNGGDGLAIARMLFQFKFDVRVVICDISKNLTDDYKINFQRLQLLKKVSIENFYKHDSHPQIEPGSIVIDAIFGSGLNRPIPNYIGELFKYLNQLSVIRVAVDVPSGLFADKHSEGEVFKADFTFSFELPKLAFLFPENHKYVGEWIFRSIGLDSEFIKNAKTSFYFIDNQLIKPILRTRKKYDHKGTFGHALIVAGEHGKVGAAILAAKSCLRSGAGLVTIHAPKCAFQILQIAVPEAMVSSDDYEFCITNIEVSDKFNSVGIGPGIGINEMTATALYNLIKRIDFPLVLDADALNILSQNTDWFKDLPENSILTPHPKEFERLFGSFENDFDRNNFQRKFAQKWGIFIVLKGAHTAIACPDGSCYFNSTGNPGMATGGSGDVLTGILTGLLAQGYSPKETCLLGVYLHGLAGDIAVKTTGQEALLAGDINENIGQAYSEIRNTQPTTD